ncbi:hypothetical protein [Metabacillus litoralis]|uniref:hypothetical protein n=1 Tax=Metabacillus litoralis TaxID=152268 RepID=UPI001CFE0113|nr:hypothetical protein [Metabacillus litoralis]
MKETLEVFIPSWIQIFYSMLAFFIPFSLYRVSNLFYKKGNPSWKKEEMRNQEE